MPNKNPNLDALQHALKVFTRPEPRDPELQMNDAVELNEWGIFSVSHIIRITGMPERAAYDLLNKTTKVGGRFNPEALPFIYDLWLEYVDSGNVNVRQVKLIAEMGVSGNFLSKLTGISQRTINRRLKD